MKPGSLQGRQGEAERREEKEGLGTAERLGTVEG
jgi:hypothetical protein